MGCLTVLVVDMQGMVINPCSTGDWCTHYLWIPVEWGMDDHNPINHSEFVISQYIPIIYIYILYIYCVYIYIYTVYIYVPHYICPLHIPLFHVDHGTCERFQQLGFSIFRSSWLPGEADERWPSTGKGSRGELCLIYEILTKKCMIFI